MVSAHWNNRPLRVLSSVLRNRGADLGAFNKKDKGGKKAYCCISNTAQILELLERTMLVVFTVGQISLGKINEVGLW